MVMQTLVGILAGSFVILALDGRAIHLYCKYAENKWKPPSENPGWSVCMSFLEPKATSGLFCYQSEAFQFTLFAKC